MKVGSLVRITKATLGVPAGTLALVMQELPLTGSAQRIASRSGMMPHARLFQVLLFGEGGAKRRIRRYLDFSLEVLKS